MPPTRPDVRYRNPVPGLHKGEGTAGRLLRHRPSAARGGRRGGTAPVVEGPGVQGGFARRRRWLSPDAGGSPCGAFQRASCTAGHSVAAGGAAPSAILIGRQERGGARAVRRARQQLGARSSVSVTGLGLWVPRSEPWRVVLAFGLLRPAGNATGRTTVLVYTWPCVRPPAPTSPFVRSRVVGGGARCGSPGV